MEPNVFAAAGYARPEANLMVISALLSFSRLKLLSYSSHPQQSMASSKVSATIPISPVLF